MNYDHAGLVNNPTLHQLHQQSNLKSLCKADAAPDVDIVDEDVVEVAALLVAEEGVRHPNLPMLI